jgi:hypothetical protein
MIPFFSSIAITNYDSMFFQLLYIHLFRPFLRYSQDTSPLPANVSPRRLCSQAAQAISKLLRLYKRSHGLRQICNIAVYIAHSACTIHLLNLPDKNAKRDITHGVKHLEEISDSWLCARRTLAILSVLARQWKVDLPEEAAAVFERTDIKFAAWNNDIRSKFPKPSQSPGRQNSTPSINTMITQGGGGLGGIRSQTVMSPNIMAPQSPIDAHFHANFPGFHQRNKRPSVDSSAGSPSAAYNTTEQIPKDGNDWWMADQRELAVGFGHWPAPAQRASPPRHFNNNGVGPTHTESGWVTTSNSVTSPMSASSLVASPNPRRAVSALSREEDMTLMNMFSGLSEGAVGGQTGWGSMHYPDESEWYQ